MHLPLTELASAPVDPRLCFDEADMDLCTPLWSLCPAPPPPPCEGDCPGAADTPFPAAAPPPLGADDPTPATLEVTFRRDKDEPDRLPSLSAYI